VTRTTTIASQKGGVGKTTTAINIGVLLGREGLRTLVVDTDPQCSLTRQLGLAERSFGVNLVDVLAGRALAHNAIVGGVHGVDVIPAARELAGVEMSLVGELGRERFLHEGQTLPAPTRGRTVAKGVVSEAVELTIAFVAERSRR
jgi:chromosome partitioning protein